MGRTDFKNLPAVPDEVQEAAAMAASDAVHLSALPVVAELQPSR